jgi:hypothetical protein
MANTYLDESSPADSDPITLGAGAIRTFKQEMDLLIDQVWATTGLFNAGWITAPGANITGGGSMFAPGAIQTADIAPTAVTTALLGANAVGPGQINPTAITTALLAAASAATQLTVPTASVNTAAIQNGAVGTSQIAPTSITSSLLAAGLIKGAAIGQYAGSNSSAAAVTTLSFQPTFVLLLTGQSRHGFGVSFSVELVGGISSPIHASWDDSTSAITGLYAGGSGGGIEWTSNGFTVVGFNFPLNQAGQTHTYVALLI